MRHRRAPTRPQTACRGGSGSRRLRRGCGGLRLLRILRKCTAARAWPQWQWPSRRCGMNWWVSGIEVTRRIIRLEVCAARARSGLRHVDLNSRCAARSTPSRSTTTDHRQAIDPEIVAGALRRWRPATGIALSCARANFSARGAVVVEIDADDCQAGAGIGLGDAVERLELGAAGVAGCRSEANYHDFAAVLRRGARSRR